MLLPMGRVTRIKVRDQDILRIDFSNATPDEVLAAMAEAKSIIMRGGEDSWLTLTLVKGSRYDKRVSAAMQEYVAHNKPFVHGAAVVGRTGLQALLYSTITRFTGRTIKTFDEEMDARVWLASLAPHKAA